jgi:SurA-like protein
MTRLRLPLLLLAAACLAVALGCARDDEPLATVNGEGIEHEDVESLIELYKGRAEAREGEDEEKGKEEVGHAQEVGALEVLVQREVLEQKAKELGVTVDEDAVEELAERLEGPESARQESDEEGEEGEEAVRKQIRETARAQLLYDALQRRVTQSVRVRPAEVIAYYRSHRSTYPTPPPRAGDLPPRTVEQTIRRGLTATARDQAMARFVARVRRELAPKIEYREGWSPHELQP